MEYCECGEEIEDEELCAGCRAGETERFSMTLKDLPDSLTNDIPDSYGWNKEWKW